MTQQEATAVNGSIDRIASVQGIFVAGLLCIVLASVLMATPGLHVPGGLFVLLPGAIIVACAAALIAFGQAPASRAARFVAIAVLVILFFLPFGAVALMIFAGSDPMKTFVVSIGLFSLLFCFGLSIVLTLAALAFSHAVRSGYARSRPTES